MHTYLVTLAPGSDRQAVITALAATGGTVDEFSAIPRVLKFTATPSAVAAAEAIPGVLSVAPDDPGAFSPLAAHVIPFGMAEGAGQLPLVYHGQPRTGRSFGSFRELVWPGQAATFEYDPGAAPGDGSGVNVYVVDTGVDSAHSEIAGRYGARLYDEYPASPSLAPHGTACAGIAAGTTMGVAPGATVYDSRCFPSDGSNVAGSVLVAGMNAALSHFTGQSNPGVMSCSFGGYSASDAYSAVLAACVDAGLPVVAAAGNDGLDLGATSGALDYWPAENSDSLTVGGCDERFRVHPGSNWSGQTDIYASFFAWTLSRPGDARSGPLLGSGTSFACPMVAGMVARALTGTTKMTTRAEVDAFKAQFLLDYGVEDVLTPAGAALSGAKRLYLPGVTLTGVSPYAAPPRGLGQTVPSPGSGGSYDYSGKTVIFALMGQSNMVGRYGPVDAAGADATDASILMWDDNGGTGWITAANPLDHIDETPDTVGPGLSFAKDFKAGESPARVLLVGMAKGGTGFLVGDWLPNRVGTTYEIARARWEAAYAAAVADYGAANVVVGGALWIQGEDEIQDYWSLFATANQSRWEYLTMPTTLFETVRGGDFSGWGADTPVVFGQVPAGTGLTGTTAYDEIQAAIADVGNRMIAAAAAPGTDLARGDSVHYNAASARTMGSRMYAAHVAARAGSPAIQVTPPAFSPDPANVETAFAFSAVGVGTGAPIIPQAGTKTVIENKRVWINNGAFVFDRDAELRWTENRQTRPFLTNRDFLFKATINTDGNFEQGVWSMYETVGNQRSYALRVNTGPTLQFYGSDDGASATQMFSVPISLNTEYEVAVRRVGTALTLHLNGVQQASYTLPANYTFNSPDATAKCHIGDHRNNKEFRGTMKSFSLEFLS